MDADRFDSLTRVLGARTPRRTVFAAGAGFGAALLGAMGLRSANAATVPPLGHYTAVRQYALTGKVNDARKALKGLVPLIEKSPGFVDFSVVDAGNGVVLTVSVFSDKLSSGSAAKIESDWIAKHAAKFFPTKPFDSEGDAILFSSLEVGCPCSTGVQDSCGNAGLSCCAPEGTAPGGKGICITSASICGTPPTPTPAATTPAPTVAPTLVPVAPTLVPVAPTEVPACSVNPGGACASSAECCVGQCGSGVCYCVDPSRPEVGCPCTTGDASACGGRPDTCCPTEAGAHAAGTCLSPMASCAAHTGCRADGFACPTTCTAGSPCPVSAGGCCSGACLDDGTCGAGAAACHAADSACTANGDCCSNKCSPDGRCYCIDPSRPVVGCPCTAGDASGCGGRPELCCHGSCLSPMASCL